MASQKTKVLVAVGLFLAAGAYGYYKYKSLHPEGINNGVTEDGPGQMEERREEMRKTMDQAQKYAGVTPEQAKKLEALRESTTNPREMWRHQGEVLTEEQRTKVREFMRTEFGRRRSERDAKTKKALPDGEFDRYQEKRQQMWGGRGGRGGPGGGRGGRGGEGGAPRGDRGGQPGPGGRP